MENSTGFQKKEYTTFVTDKFTDGDLNKLAPKFIVRFKEREIDQEFIFCKVLNGMGELTLDEVTKETMNFIGECHSNETYLNYDIAPDVDYNDAENNCIAVLEDYIRGLGKNYRAGKVEMKQSYINTQSYLTEEDQLINAYIGKEAEKIYKPDLKKSSVNIGAGIVCGLFGPVWFFYRKCYLYGLIILAASIGVGFVLPEGNNEGLLPIKVILYAFFANMIYIHDVKRKVRKIKDQNILKSKNELIEMARRKGGISKAAAVTYIIILIAALTFYASQIYEINELQKELGQEFFNENVNKQSTVTQSTVKQNSSTNAVILVGEKSKINVEWTGVFEKNYESDTYVSMYNEDENYEVVLNYYSYYNVESYISESLKSSLGYLVSDKKYYKDVQMSEPTKFISKDGREYTKVKLTYSVIGYSQETKVKEEYAITEISPEEIYVVELKAVEKSIEDDEIQQFLDIKIVN
ncbi:MAG TPA: hypothetical protein DCP90_05545 [Clostridiales bacterium]|nr:MAG: hypothetical protein A2Y22_05680 [Clostridiales bacterium GWD2_32_59]HAN10065.1 hypothetical protein [Clostridiales bacterium]